MVLAIVFHCLGHSKNVYDEDEVMMNVSYAAACACRHSVYIHSSEYVFASEGGGTNLYEPYTIL